MSKDNSLLRQARAVRDGKAVDLIFVEGLRLCEEAYSSGLDIEAVIYSDEIALKERAAAVISKLVKCASAWRLLARLSWLPSHTQRLRKESSR